MNNLESYVSEVEKLDIEEVKNDKLSDVIAKFHAKHLVRLYILKDNKPIFVFTPQEIVEIFFNNLVEENAYEFLKDKQILDCYDSSMHIIDAYYQMRRDNLPFMPVCKDGEFIGEIDFNVLSLKIAYVVVKDELSGVYNRKYFDVIVEEYKDFNKPLGIIFIEIKDLPIFEGLYGVDMDQKIIKSFADTIKRSVRKIDFVFRWDNQLRVIIFHNLEVTAKVFERIKDRLNNLEVEGIKIPFNMCMSHVPEITNDIYLAIEECEEDLVKRD